MQTISFKQHCLLIKIKIFHGAKKKIYDFKNFIKNGCVEKRF